MDGAMATACGGGGPTPFLMKTYDMVDDPSTNDIVSWSPNNKSSFVVWNQPEFARLLLPTFFKHNNFSSFVRQLNTYGFRKCDPEIWEFANEDFVKDQKHLLQNIHRRRPIHSHSHLPGSTVDPEREAFEEEIDKLSREKTALEANVLRFRQQQSAAKLQLQDLTQRVGSIGQRQENLLTCLDKAIRNPDFVEHLAQKIDSMDFSAYSKKRRLPQVDHSQSVLENSFMDNHSNSRPEFGNLFHQDFSNELRLELSQAVSDINVTSHSTQSSNEDGGIPLRRLSERCTKDENMRTGGLLFTPETLELSDTGTSFTLKMDSSLSQNAKATSPRLRSLQQSLASNEVADGNISCQLNLSLASSLQVNRSQTSGGMTKSGQEVCMSLGSRSNATGNASDLRVSSMNQGLSDGDTGGMTKSGQEVCMSLDLRSNATGNASDLRVSSVNQGLSDGDTILTTSKEGLVNNQGPAAAQVQVNDGFWEQFLTERPGSSDIEVASSSLSYSYDDQEDRRPGHGFSRNAKRMEHLTL